MKSLNPGNDWLPFKNDDIDHEDDADFHDPNRIVKHKFKTGSSNYGHVVSKTSPYYEELKDDQIR